MTWLTIGLIPLLSAFIGYLTNWVAVRMLFRPRRPLRWPGVTLQGLIPRQQNEMAARIGKTVEEEVLTGHLIRQLLSEIDLAPHLETFARQIIRERLAPRLQAMPLVGSFVNDATVTLLEGMVREEMTRAAGPLMETLAAEGERKLPVKDLIEQRIAAFDLDKLETVVRQVAAKELQAIEWMGAVLGLVVGFAQVGLIWVAGWWPGMGA